MEHLDKKFWILLKIRLERSCSLDVLRSLTASQHDRPNPKHNTSGNYSKPETTVVGRSVIAQSL